MSRKSGLFPFRTKRAPVEFDLLLPAIACAARDGDQARLRELLIDRRELFARGYVHHTTGLSIVFSGLLAMQATGLPATQAAREAMWPIVLDVARTLPALCDDADLLAWLNQQTDGERAVPHMRASDLDLRTLCCMVAIEGAAARMRGWSDAYINSGYKVARDTYEHTTAVLS